MIRFTATVKASLSVDTDCVSSTNLVAALVDIITSQEWISIISLSTLAHLARVGIRDTLSIVSTLTWITHISHSAGGAAFIWVTIEPWVTLALVGNVVDTVTVGSTSWCADGW